MRVFMKNKKYRIMRKLYTNNRITRNLCERYFYRSEKGDFYSETKRRIFKDVYGISIGFASYGCFVTDINYGYPIKIGNYCSFAANVHFIPGNHPITDVSTHPFFHRTEYGYLNSSKDNQVPCITHVGHDVWIGRDTVILPNCKKIGNGAVIGAGSVVTHDIEPYSIVVGNPAREIRRRFNNDTIASLEKSEWYLYSPEKLKKAINYADDIEKFLYEVEKLKKA